MSNVRASCYVTVEPQFRGQVVTGAKVVNMTTRRPSSTDGYVFKLNIDLPSEIFDVPEITADVRIEHVTAIKTESDAIPVPDGGAGS